jgi:hypothetical protein
MGKAPDVVEGRWETSTSRHERSLSASESLAHDPGHRQPESTRDVHPPPRHPVRRFNALSDFVAAQGLARALTDAFGHDKAPGAPYSWPETRRHLLDGYRLGVERVWHVADLEQEPLLCGKRDRDRWPDPTRLDRELARCDSTVETVYGEQEGARPGLNPHQRGRPAYHPVLCRERNRGLVVPSQLRPGATGSATGAAAFLRQSGARWPHSRRRTVLIRADRGFDAEALDAQGERRGWHYVSTRRVTADLASRIWTPAAHGRWRGGDAEAAWLIEVAELRVRRGGGSRGRRVGLTRPRDAANPHVTCGTPPGTIRRPPSPTGTGPRRTSSPSPTNGPTGKRSSTS